MIIHDVPMFLYPKLVIMMFQKKQHPALGRIPIRPGPGPGISRQHRLREDFRGFLRLDFRGWALLEFCRDFCRDSAGFLRDFMEWNGTGITLW